jgi:MATE family multidrug resistance protein
MSLKNDPIGTAPAKTTMTYRLYIALVIPFIISTMTTPLLGAVDTALVGHLPNPAFIGGVAVGAIIFNTMYWLFGFLRVSTTGFTAQALNDPDKQRSALLRPLAMALVIGVVFIILQGPIFNAAIELIQPEQSVIVYADRYFTVLIWGAPFTLINYVVLGWLMGFAKTRAVILIQVFINLLNIILSIIFVWGFGLEVAGVATATLIAQISSTLMGFVLVKRYLPSSTENLNIRALLSPRAMKQILAVNADLMIRTVCLLAMTNHFIATGASFGTEVLAANAVLFQVQYIMAYAFDGFANASSVFSGKALGERNLPLYRRVLTYTLASSLAVSLLISAIWLAADSQIIALFTNQSEIIALCRQYSVWLTLFPICAALGLLFYGVFSGITYTAPIRNSMILSLLVWFISWFILVPAYGNDGLWAAFLLFSLGRSLFLLPWLPASVRRLQNQRG